MPPEIFRLVEPSSQAAAATWRWPVAILMVRGMRTARAVLRVRNALLRVPGVVWVEGVLDPGFVRVAYDPSLVDPLDLPSAITAGTPEHTARFLLVSLPAANDEGGDVPSPSACASVEEP